jgi:hypothetical protein
MKIKAVFEGILAGLISAVLSYSAPISRATFTAIAMRRKMPDAWFSGLIVRQHFPASTEMFSCITNSASSSQSRRTSGRNQPSPKDPGGIDESIDLSQDR